VSDDDPTTASARTPEPRREPAARWEAMRVEALRLNDRYLREVVLGFGLCPWAGRAIEGNELRRAVVFDETPAIGAALSFIDELARAGRAVAVGMLIFPCVGLPSGGFDRYTETVRRADRERCRNEGRQDFVMAAFHPEAAQTFETPYQLISFIRRTPDPTIQLVRADRIESLRAAQPTLSDDLALQNYATVHARGSAPLDAVLRDIRRDRDQTYARLAAFSQADSARPVGAL
jgi:hypothetical protein